MSVIKICTYVIVAAILILKIALEIKNNNAIFQEYTDLFLVFVLVFVAFSDRIKKMSLSPKEGINIEQQFESLNNDLKNISLLSSEHNKEHLQSLIQGSSSMPRDLWSTLITYRLALRALLRRACTKKNIRIGKTTSMSEMLDNLLRENFISREVYSELDFIRDKTFVVEWGSGKAPAKKEIVQLVNNAADMLRKFDEIID